MTSHRVRLIASTEDEIGTLDAPKGTAPWSRAMHMELRQMWQEGTTQLKRFQRYLTLMERERGYQQLDDPLGHPFPSMRAFSLARPPHGLGFDPTVLDAIAQETRQMTVGEKMAEVQMLQAHGGDHKSAAYQGSHANLDSIKRGANTEYYLARLKRDHPDIAEALVHGEYPSVRAAAKAAGLVSEPTPLETLHRAWRKVSQEDRLRFLHDTLTQAEWELLQRPQGIPQGAPSTPGGE